MTWAPRMDERPNPGENEDPGARLGRFRPSGRKRLPGGLPGETAGDALRVSPTGIPKSDTFLVRFWLFGSTSEHANRRGRA
jgi:hypothetical protein